MKKNRRMLPIVFGQHRVMGIIWKIEGSPGNTRASLLPLEWNCSV